MSDWPFFVAGLGCPGREGQSLLTPHFGLDSGSAHGRTGGSPGVVNPFLCSGLQWDLLELPREQCLLDLLSYCPLCMLASPLCLIPHLGL